MGNVNEIGESDDNVHKELESLKSSQIRVEALAKLRHFYEELSDYIEHFEDVFYGYKEDFENIDDYQEEVEVLFQRNGILDLDLKTVIARTEEKKILLKECIQYIIICVSATVIPKRKDVMENRKITKGRLIETIKVIEQYILSIHFISSKFQSAIFKETQQVRISFMLDAMHHLLMLISIEPKHYQLLFDPKIVPMLEESRSSSKKHSLIKHLKKRYKTVLSDFKFRQEFMERFRLNIEGMTKSYM
ncbi:hypothetical protein NYE70_14580 [Paenibacillus sp. FSL R5-0407]|uniref:hypothetical protein n=1 Tax=Paenibacillus sp. FSL R5-0407 TaxID=2975320 RepID=UPI0030FB0A26